MIGLVKYHDGVHQIYEILVKIFVSLKRKKIKLHVTLCALFSPLSCCSMNLRTNNLNELIRITLQSESIPCNLLPAQSVLHDIS